MTSLYNRFSGQQLDPLRALSDGVFAVAMTLLVLDLRVPLEHLDSNRSLWHELHDLGPNLFAYLLSFTMLGTFWLAQHSLLSLCSGADRNLTWLHLGYLFVVTLLPFSAGLLAAHVTLSLAVGIYWLNLLLLGLGLAATSGYARRALIPAENHLRLRVFRRRILVAQVAYGVAAALCLLNTYVSVAALALAQLFFTISPRAWIFERFLNPTDSGQ